ncbi:MAG: 50S ribosomal protein L10 [Chloroflexi bacterium SZAS-1]|jgi:large subunit ribosomal protein L10|nr:50S ribosomal protein L10 [Chloroflexi bacterium SZAS-1]HNP88170.1 50S ribosomal protein L10 [Kouleothrix sp.]
MPTQRKIESVADLTDKLSRTQLTLVTDYRGLTVAEITDLRKKLRETGAELIVAKNTLTLRAAKETGYEALEPLLSGPTALAFAFQDASKTAKVINDFNKGPKKLVVRGGMLGNSLLGANVLEQVASMPTREQILAQIVGGVSAPVSGVVGVLNAAITNVLYVLQARIDQLQPAGDAAA